MFEWIRRNRKTWTLQGWDTFAGESYHLPGSYSTESRARRAAKKYLEKLERSQPTAVSGGQDGIQDQVYIHGPDGQCHRILP